MRLSAIESIRQPYPHVYLSPHMDDAVLSCGGRIAMQVSRQERVLVVTAFSGGDNEGKPAGKLSIPIRDLQSRRKEDEIALGRLGADFIWLGYPDGIFGRSLPLLRYGLHLRARDRYATSIAALRTDLEKICQATSCRNLSIPLGIGQHIDHHLAFLTGAGLNRNPPPPFSVSFYEEIPYALIPHALHYRFRAIGFPGAVSPGVGRSWVRKIAEIHRAIRDIPTLAMQRPLRNMTVLIGLATAILYLEAVMKPSRGAGARRLFPETVDVTPFFEQKLAAIMAYRSETPLLFDTCDALRHSLERYSSDIGCEAGQYWERSWKAFGDW